MPLLQQFIDDGAIAHAAADLQPHRRLRGEFPDERAIAERAVARTIQVDDVQPAGAERTIAR